MSLPTTVIIAFFILPFLDHRNLRGGNGLAEAARLAPANAYVVYNQGCLLAYQNATEAAIKAFSRALEIDPQLPEAYYNRALLHVQLGETQQSKADFSKAGQLGLYKAYAQMKGMKAATK